MIDVLERKREAQRRGVETSKTKQAGIFAPGFNTCPEEIQRRSAIGKAAVQNQTGIFDPETRASLTEAYRAGGRKGIASISRESMIRSGRNFNPVLRRENGFKSIHKRFHSFKKNPRCPVCVGDIEESRGKRRGSK